jgi:hypothetical protein
MSRALLGLTSILPANVEMAVHAERFPAPLLLWLTAAR